MVASILLLHYENYLSNISNWKTFILALATIIIKHLLNIATLTTISLFSRSVYLKPE